MMEHQKNGPIAQLVEPPAHNRKVPGSIPGGPTMKAFHLLNKRDFRRQSMWKPWPMGIPFREMGARNPKIRPRILSESASRWMHFFFNLFERREP